MLQRIHDYVCRTQGNIFILYSSISLICYTKNIKLTSFFFKSDLLCQLRGVINPPAVSFFICGLQYICFLFKASVFEQQQQGLSQLLECDRHIFNSDLIYCPSSLTTILFSGVYWHSLLSWHCHFTERTICNHKAEAWETYIPVKYIFWGFISLWLRLSLWIRLSLSHWIQKDLHT